MSFSEYQVTSQPFNTWRQRLAHWLDTHAVSESAIIMVTAVIVGIGAGLGAVAFRFMTEEVFVLAYETLAEEVLVGITPFHLLIIPALGGLVVGPMVYFYAREAKGHGIPEVMESVALRGGRIRPRVAVIKAVASAITIGTGGSAGSEGPIGQIGAAIGSTVGQILKLSDDRVKNLVACGVAGGIAAIFNAPIGGALFAQEVIVGQFNVAYFGAVVISAVTAAVVAHSLEGVVPLITVPAYALVSAWELPLYALMGALAGITSVGFSRMLYFFEDLWDDLKFFDYLKPMLGGLLLGTLGFFTFKFDGYPRIFSVGYTTIDQVVLGELAIGVTLSLLVLKMVATSLTLGCGGSGGVFAPSLFMGAMLGSSFGQIAHQLWPNITAPSGAYAVVGMAAFVAGAAHTPVTAILILFEMTGDYKIILPLMLATVVSTLVSRIVSKESIYTLKLSRRGIRLQQGQDIDVMQGVTVGEVMDTAQKAVRLDMTLAELSDQFAITHHHGLPVIDAHGNLVGAVSIQDLDRAVAEDPLETATVANIATTSGLVVAYPHETIGEALRRLGTRDLSLLPVIKNDSDHKLLGTIRRRNIVRAYNHALIKRAQQEHQQKIMRVGNIDGASFLHIDIPTTSPAVGQRLSDIKLPGDSLIVSVRRGAKLFVAHGYTILKTGDKVTVFAEQQCIPMVRQQLTGVPDTSNEPEAPIVRHKDVTIPVGANCNGCKVSDLNLPYDCILISIQRGQQIIVPHGSTVLKAGDIVQLFGKDDDLQEATKQLSR